MRWFLILLIQSFLENYVFFYKRNFFRSNGIRSTRKEEIDLKKIQQLQIQEKRFIDNEKKHLELMWHHDMLKHVQRKVSLFFQIQ